MKGHSVFGGLSKSIKSRFSSNSSDKENKSDIFSEQDFNSEKLDKNLVWATALSFILIVSLAVISILINLSFTVFIGVMIFFVMWLLWFFQGVLSMKKFDSMDYQTKSSYWTYQLTKDYKTTTSLINTFKKQIASSNLVDMNTKVDDVIVDMISTDPIAFDFFIRSAAAQNEQVTKEVATWGNIFGSSTGVVSRVASRRWNVIYPTEGAWGKLMGKTIDRSQALHAALGAEGLNYVPFGVNAYTMEELSLDLTDKSALIYGEHGYGKTALLYVMLNTLMADQGEPTIIFITARPAESALISQRCWCVQEQHSAMAWIRALELEMKRRTEYLVKKSKIRFRDARAARSDSSSTPFNNEYRPIVLIIDEGVAYLNPSTKAGVSMQKVLSKIAKIGKPLGVTYIISSSSPRNDIIPPDVANMTEQIICFRQDSKDAEQDIFGYIGENDPHPSQLPLAEPPCGGGIGFAVSKTAATKGKLTATKIYRVTAEEVQKTAFENSRSKIQDTLTVNAKKFNGKTIDELAR